MASHMKSELTIDALPAETIDAIRTNAAHFPAQIQSRGRSYLAEGRVGPLEVERNRISATIRGRRNYRAIWQWDGTTADPRCTCPDGPVCKHAFALARAIEGARTDHAATAAGNARGRARQREHRRDPFRGATFRENQIPPERARAGTRAPGDRGHAHASHRVPLDRQRTIRAVSQPSRDLSIQRDVVLLGLMPNMHLRGKDFLYRVTYPDGKSEILLSVPRYNFEWQLVYRFKEPVFIEKGSVLTVTAHYDNSPNNREGLPIGFVIDGDSSSGQLGMTCAACHTGQLEYTKDGVTHALRIDGAPANADFQQFLTDLAAAARATLAQSARFDAFARAVLDAGYTAAKAAQLKSEFAAWVGQFGDFMDASLPPSPWGPGRLDAFGMIFNRVAGRDLGVPGNFKVADAPVSYPFLWNASRQDHTQWNGGVPNGLFIQALARNTGEVFGVFADFKPRIVAPGTPITPTLIDFKSNSADFAGLQTLEEKIATLKPPPWPRDIFGLNDELAQRGKPLFDAHCGECHAEKVSPLLSRAWVTPVVAVGTDPKMVRNAARTSNPGLYTGAALPPPPIGARFRNPAKTGDILAASVVGALLAEAFVPPPTPDRLEQSGVWRAIRKDLAELLPDKTLDDLSSLRLDLMKDLQDRIKSRLGDMFRNPGPPDTDAAYESRVLRGIWATAPYLHNGSVPNLWELLTPPKARKSAFMVGSRAFDPKNVGYATDQSPFKSGRFVTDPQNANGNGNGGHVYGTDLTPDERWAVIEYLKTL
jgi:hypothetical protein